MKKHQNFKPNYMQIQDYILYKIESGEYPVGSKIPSEVELAEMFSVSRITANKAIKELSIMGILERTRGRGTFVKDFSEEKNNSKAFVSAVKLELNAKRQHQLLQFKLISPYPELRESFSSDQGDSFYEIILANKSASGIESIDYSYIPCSLVPDILPNLDSLCNHFIFNFLKEQPIEPPKYLKIFVNIPEYSFLESAKSFLGTENNVNIWKTNVYDQNMKIQSCIYTACPDSSAETPLFTFLL